MPWPVYTDRLLSVHAAGVWVGWTVPAGRRAVVKCIAAANTSSVDVREVVVDLAGTYVYYARLPAASVGGVYQLTAVCYAGELLRAYTQAANAGIVVSGYVFAEQSLLGARAPVAVEVPPPDGWVAYEDPADELSAG